MKRLIAFILALLLPVTLMSGCAQPASTAAPAETPQATSTPAVSAPTDSPPPETPPPVRLSVVCTIFPQYDWVRQILGGRAEDFDLTFLLDNRIDLHNYQPSVDDIVKISTCDLFIYVGGESDEWAESVLHSAANPDMIVINLMEILGDDLKLEELGIEENTGGHGHDHGHDHDGDEEHEDEYDEHVWLSLRHAQTFCAVITDALSSLDPVNAEEYQSNMAAYVRVLSALDAEYTAAVDAAPVKTMLFGDRFPFRYLADDYGIAYLAAFSGCSAETEASFETVIFLAEKVNELNLNTVMVTESSDQAIAKTVIGSTKDKNQQILVLDSLQSVTAGDARGGASYLSVMEKNLNVLKEALK
ncbi:MAG: metal ABC transporter substrate-binding protein [Oscillospiraceae bacterium]|nr:metal ABC transporter substrate-binding protein [Oscillospiraceae bacterium]